MADGELQQPRFYRVRCFDREREVFVERRVPAALDLTPGPAVLAAEAKLHALLQVMAYADGARGARVRDYHLTVGDWPEGVVHFHWPATSWPDRT